VSQLARLKVVAPAVAAKYGGQRDEIQRFSRQLNVRYALDGRIEASAGEIGAAVLLVDTGSDNSLWSTRLPAAATVDARHRRWSGSRQSRCALPYRRRN